MIGDTEENISLTFRYYKLIDVYDTLVCEEILALNSTTSNEKEHLFTLVPKLSFSISPWIFLYTDIIKPSITGDTSANILKIIPLNIKNFGKAHMIEFETPEFIPLSLTNFQTIKFEVRNHDGYLFSSDEGKILINLLFQKN